MKQRAIPRDGAGNEKGMRWMRGGEEIRKFHAGPSGYFGPLPRQRSWRTKVCPAAKCTDQKRRGEAHRHDGRFG